MKRDATDGWRDYLQRLARGVRRYALAHPHAFPLVTTYQMQVSAIVKYLASKSGGSLAGKKIVYLYHDSAYGKEPIVALQAEARQLREPATRPDVMLTELSQIAEVVG